MEDIDGKCWEGSFEIEFGSNLEQIENLYFQRRSKENWEHSWDFELTNIKIADLILVESVYLDGREGMNWKQNETNIR